MSLEIVGRQLTSGGWLSQGESLRPYEEDQEAEEKLVAEEGGHLERPLQDQEEQQDADRGGVLEGDQVRRGRRSSKDFPLTAFVHGPAWASRGDNSKQCLDLLCVRTDDQQQPKLSLTRGWRRIWGWRRMEEMVSKRIDSGFPLLLINLSPLLLLTILWSCSCSASYCTDASTIG